MHSDLGEIARLVWVSLPPGERRAALDRMLAGTTEREKAAARDIELRAAAALDQFAPFERRTLARHLLERLKTLQLGYLAAPIDPGTADGRLAAMLLVTGGRLPSFETVRRALGSSPHVHEPAP